MDDKHSDLINLKWTLQDIKAQRDNLVAAKPDHVADLVERGLIQMVDDKPVLTAAGSSIIE